MKAKYVAAKDEGTAFYLTDGKIYEIEGEIDIEGEKHYLLVDDDKEDIDASSYCAASFEVIEE
jgi:hypothetical protein